MAMRSKQAMGLITFGVALVEVNDPIEKTLASLQEQVNYVIANGQRYPRSEVHFNLVDVGGDLYTVVLTDRKVNEEEAEFLYHLSLEGM